MTNKGMLDRIKKFNFPPLNAAEIERLENKLNVHFSREFLELSKVVNFEYFDAFNINTLLGEGEYSVIGDTLRLRKDANLPENVLFFCEDDASVLLMECLGDHERVLWLAVEDFENFCKGDSLEYDATIFDGFTSFFEYLLAEEEKK